jgi:hypothetical protein
VAARVGFLFRIVQTGSGDQPTSYLISVEVSFSGVKRSGCEADPFLYILLMPTVLEIYLHSPINLVLKQLRTRKSLPFNIVSSIVKQNFAWHFAHTNFQPCPRCWLLLK